MSYTTEGDFLTPAMVDVRWPTALPALRSNACGRIPRSRTSSPTGPGVARKRRIRGGWGLTLDTLRVATDDLRRDNAAARLAGLIAEIGDADALAHVGDWIVDSPTGNELIARFGKGS